MDKVYYYTYYGLPYCGREMTPIHALSPDELPPVDSLCRLCKDLRPEGFGVERMNKIEFYGKEGWPK